MNDEIFEKATVRDSDEIRKLIYTLLFLLFASLLGGYISYLFDKHIVDQVICTIYKERLTFFQTVLTILLSFYTLYYIIIKLLHTQYNVRYHCIVLIFIPLFLYLKERLFDYNYIFTLLYGFDKKGLAFLDFPFFLLAIVIVILIANRIRDNIPNYSGDLIVDLPLKLLNHDKFERKQVYESLVKQISNISFNEDRSFIVGIVNKWAEGKTSFLNFTTDELAKDQNTIVVNFNAWFTSQSDSFTNDFFKTLDDELSKYIYTGSLMRRYANNLTQINSVFNLTKYLPKAWISEDSNLEYFENIEKLLKRLNKRIFIIIDDVDRLDNKEIFNVLRMIRNSANFPYLIFLVPFDKEYAINALTENKIYNPKEYLKKIFDVEISLTPINESYLQPIFKNILNEFIDKGLGDSTSEEIAGLKQQVDGVFANIGLVNYNKPKYSTIKRALFKIIRNNRDIIRFTNSIKLSLKHNFDKLYFPDLIILELIKYENLVVYRKLFEGKNYLRTITKNERKVLELHTDDNKESPEAFSFIDSFGDYDNLILELKEDEKVNNYIISLVEGLFNEPEDQDFNSKLSIYYEFNYLNYIQFSINGISYEDIESLLDGKQTD